MSIFSETEYGALLSSCRLYRYKLWRIWDKSLPVLCFVMLNPSTADERENDRTILVCMERARQLGCGGIVVVNVFALRATKPADMLWSVLPVCAIGEASIYTRALREAVMSSKLAICAWGPNATHQGQVGAVLDILKPFHNRLHYLRMTKTGHPEHPLYVPYSEQPKRLNVGEYQCQTRTEPQPARRRSLPQGRGAR